MTHVTVTVRTVSTLLVASFYGIAAAQTGQAKYKVAVRRDDHPTPAPINCAAAAHDSKRDAMLIFGGVDPDRKDAPPVLRRLDLDKLAWSIIETKGAAPRAGTLAGIVFEPKRDGVYVFGGWAGGADKPSGELWVLSLAGDSPRTWKRLADGPPARNGCVLVLDAERDRLLLFAGDGGPHPQYGFTPLNDLWAFDLAAEKWTRLTATGDTPGPRWNLASAVDSASGRMFVFGGVGYHERDMVRDNFVYELDLAKLKWTKHAAKGPQPAPVEGATLTFDSGKGLLVVLGGLSVADAGEPGSTSIWLYDLKNEKWVEEARQLETTRRGHVAIYDPRRNEHVVVGGETAKERGNFYVHGKVLLDTFKVSIMSE